MSSNVSLNPVHPGGNVEVRSVAVGHRATAFWHTMTREEGRHGGLWRGAYWLRDRPHVGQSQNIFGSGRDQRLFTGVEEQVRQHRDNREQTRKRIYGYRKINAAEGRQRHTQPQNY